MPNNYPMKEDRPAELSRAHWYVDQLEALHNEGREVAQLTASEVPQWQAFALAAGDRPGTWAANVLCFFHEVCIGRGGGPTMGNKSLRPTVLADATAQPAPALTLHPNPASTWVAIDYDLLVEPTDAAIIIRDPAGREVRRFALREQRQQVVWDTRQAAPGSYTVVLLNAGRQLRTEKLIIRP